MLLRPNTPSKMLCWEVVEICLMGGGGKRVCLRICRNLLERKREKKREKTYVFDLIK